MEDGRVEIVEIVHTAGDVHARLELLEARLEEVWAEGPARAVVQHRVEAAHELRHTRARAQRTSEQHSKQWACIEGWRGGVSYQLGDDAEGRAASRVDVVFLL